MSSPGTNAHSPALPMEQRSGTLGMALFILTEASLFVMLLFAYVFLAMHNPTWPLGEPPRLVLSIPMTIVLVGSSFVLHWGEARLKAGAVTAARFLVLGTILLGAGFLVLQGFEYHHHLKSLTPGTNAYGSIFYAITGVHGLHVLVGICMLLFTLVPRRASLATPPPVTLHNVGLYWHFVDVVWLTIFTLLYILPRLGS